MPNPESKLAKTKEIECLFEKANFVLTNGEPRWVFMRFKIRFQTMWESTIFQRMIHKLGYYHKYCGENDFFPREDFIYVANGKLLSPSQVNKEEYFKNSALPEISFDDFKLIFENRYNQLLIKKDIGEAVYK